MNIISKKICFSIFLITCFMQCFGQRIKIFDNEICDNDSYFMRIIKPEIQSKALVVNEIINLVLNTDEKYRTYEELAIFVDNFGNRVTGSETLDNSTDYLIREMQKQKLYMVHSEAVPVPHWERGLESAQMLEPRNRKLSILGLAGSVTTPAEGIIADLIVLESLDNWDNDLIETINNTIVLFNINHINDSYLKFKLEATRMVAEAGGLAVLFNSFETKAVYTPNAGVIRYYSQETQIPAANIAVEDTDMLTRIYKRNIRIKIKLNMESIFHGIKNSRNLIAELRGTTYPDEQVIVSAHLDTWDVGQGALDDGGGIFISWRALALLKKLGLRTKRTLRLVLFTGKEQGRYGSIAYVKKHKQQLENVSLIMNSDFGTFEPYGLTFAANSTTSQCIVYEVLQLLHSINSTELVVGKSNDLTQTDTNEFINEGVPATGLFNENRKFLYYSHTNADTLSIIDPYFLDLCTIVWTSVSYALADLSIKLPRI